MTFDEYQHNVIKTWDCGKTPKDRLLNAIMGIAGEAGELTDLIKKQEFHGIPADRDKVLKELGDVLYYVTVCAYEHGFNLDDIAVANNRKLAARYPQGFVKGGGIREDDHATQPGRTGLHQAPGGTLP